METPSSTRRITRSQALATANNSNNIPISRKTEESEKGFSKSRQRNAKQQDRSALFDITNDSPIVGLAMGSLETETPSSRMSKKRNSITPGSGEALLRGQVKTLLQKVEEEAEFSKLSFDHRSFLHLHHQQVLIGSPIGLLAPTPANTPHVPDLSCHEELALAAIPSPVQEKFNLSQMVAGVFFDGMKEEGLESEKNLIGRSLLLDFSEKTERFDSSECSSAVTCEGGECGSKEKSIADDDDASVWSIQVNASTRDDEEEEIDDDYEEVIEEVTEEEDEDYGDQEEEEVDGALVDELCEGMRNISVIGEKKMAKFTGKHTRFLYNSDDELEGEEECGGESEASSGFSPGILRLKGLPTPKGKHLRFHEEMEEEDHP
ncbi:uncharacterized protein LOC132286314 [Cornus florida]|uniref:uncharacterized protein LOC132286314 n=1 Tax=Cornus florida TaxID=4283 RepID=UPI00289AE0D4|nr:uncharacterized protein LOC132286314 [Cornus florida]